MIEDRLAENLKLLNLTEYESKTYLALVNRGIATVKEIRELAGIPYSREYDILESLEKKGYVVVQPGRPKLYRAVHPREILSKELDLRATIIEELINVLTPIYESSTRESSFEEVIWMVKGKENVRDKLIEMLGTAKKEILVLGIKPIMDIVILRALAKAKERGVRVRVLGRARGVEALLEEAGLEFLNFEHDHSRFILVDRKELILTSEEQTNVTCALYNKNPGCIKLYVNYFMHIWSDLEQENLK